MEKYGNFWETVSIEAMHRGDAEAVHRRERRGGKNVCGIFNDEFLLFERRIFISAYPAPLR